MTQSSKLILAVLGGLVGLLALGAIAAALYLGTHAKPRVEAAASEALDMEVKVAGRASIHLFPTLHIALADVLVRKRGADVGSAGAVDLGLELLPLLHRQVQIRSIALKRVQLAVARDRDGKLNISRSSRAKGPSRTVSVGRVYVSHGTLVYSDQRSDNGIQATNCDLDVSRVSFLSGEDPLQSLSLAGKGVCAQLRTKNFPASDVKFSVAGRGGVLDFDPVTLQLFGGRGAGTARADFAGALPSYDVRVSLSQFQIEEAFKSLSPQHVGEGTMDFTASLSMQGKTMEALKRTAAGQASLHGENLKLEMGDLDEKLARYESSQTFNLLDVGAFFFGGPLGLGITKGYDFARIFEGSGGSTTVRALVSTWQVEHGVARATDVAMATPKNRVALKGALDFVNDRFDEVTVALVDAKGCSRVQQKVRGPFHQPEVEKPNVLAALAGPTRKLLTKAKELLGDDCEVFYSGSVQPPK